MAKLYHRVSRFLVRRKVNRHREKMLKWALTLEPGDLINDCTGFNVRIREIDFDVRQTGRGWYIVNADFMVTPYGGSCSLIHCGVTPPVPRDKIEKDWLDWAERYVSEGYMAQWYGKDKEAFDKEWNRINRFIDVISSGGHITNEDGMILREFCAYPDSFKE